MENHTTIREFHILPFSFQTNLRFLYCTLFFVSYVFCVFTNLVITMLIITSNHLHTPMYFFLGTLSVVDMCYPTVTVPKLLYMCISKNNTISYNDCFVQMYFYFLVSSTEDLVTNLMAFDRYVAICNPLHYHSILSKKTCMFLIFGCWLGGCLNVYSIFFTCSASTMTFCNSNTIHQFFCDGKALINIACAGLQFIYEIIFIEIFMFGVCPFICCLISYIKIINIILQINSKEGRKKAFSTCSSHLTVLIMYYAAAVSAYMVPKYSYVLEQVCSALYTIVIPMINPLIYSLRNDDVKTALKKYI